MINVTQPFLPNFEEYKDYIASIWSNKWLTNNGPMVNALELQLKKELEIEHLLYLSNGTIALQIAIQCLDIQGKILTTPFSYVATTSSILWEKCEPVFVDIDEHTWNIDPTKIEAQIDEDTKAILATHVFGVPCAVEQIQDIAQKHKLKVIYDAAHAFGVKYDEKSVLEYGDISTLSFHATKLFHTIEGGAVVSENPDFIKKMALLRNFGHDGQEKFSAVGINGKNSEFHAAMGLCNLKHIEDIKQKRKQQYLYYKNKLDAQKIQFQKVTPKTDYNYSYFPIVFENEQTLLKTLENLNAQKVFPRRYFYPSLNTISSIIQVPKPQPVAESIAQRILCLPLFHDMQPSVQDMICRIIKRTLKY